MNQSTEWRKAEQGQHSENVNLESQRHLEHQGRIWRQGHDTAKPRGNRRKNVDVLVQPTNHIGKSCGDNKQQ